MTNTPENLAEDLRGAGRLTVEAIINITDIVESVHHTITRSTFNRGKTGSDTTTPIRKKGIAGLVYRSIRSVTEMVGKGIDLPLKKISVLPGNKDPSRNREAVISVINGVLGHHLVARNNPLAISMRFRRNGKSLEPKVLADLIDKSNGKLLILVHGLCMNDLQWEKNGHDHGTELAKDLELEPIYLHYNTGLHISENGRSFADLIEATTQQFPKLELYIVAHSMGGLVSRSAGHYAEESQHKWLKNLRKMVYLGTPHHGAPLEKGGNWIDTLLEVSAYSAPFSRLGKIRSCGISDLRHGNVVDEDWQGRDRFKRSEDKRTSIPVPEDVQCYAIAATKSDEAGTIKNRVIDKIIGDGLVPVKSALGEHKKEEFNLAIPDAHKQVVKNMNHMDLLHQPEVYQMIHNWLKN